MCSFTAWSLRIAAIFIKSKPLLTCLILIKCFSYDLQGDQLGKEYRITMCNYNLDGFILIQVKNRAGLTDDVCRCF